jgi:hypothetical protein
MNLNSDCPRSTATLVAQRVIFSSQPHHRVTSDMQYREGFSVIMRHDVFKGRGSLTVTRPKVTGSIVRGKCEPS